MKRSFTVLLIGGNSGSGKTTITARLARELRMTWGAVDDFRLFLQRATSLHEQPELHAFFAELSHLNAEEAAQRYQSVGRIVSYALEIVIAHHVATNTPIILEGDTILPGFAAQHIFANLDTLNCVQGLFIIETDERVLYQNICKRGRGIGEMTEQQLQRDARFSSLYGQWLQQEAMRYQLPIIFSRPRKNSLQRALDSINSGTTTTKK